MLTALNLLQLVLYIALLALAGQGVLHVLTGQGRDKNFFYRLLQLLSKPFTGVVRAITPRKVSDAHVPVVAFLLLLLVYAVVTFERANLCVTGGLVGQAGCN